MKGAQTDNINHNKRVDDILYAMQLKVEELETKKEILPQTAEEVDLYKQRMIEQLVTLFLFLFLFFLLVA